jgi:hypothetical protein
MRMTGRPSSSSVWFMGFPSLATVSIVDQSSCKVAGSCLINGAVGSSLALDGCSRAFFSTAGSFGQLLPSAASVSFFQSAVNQLAIAFDPTNARIAVLTTSKVMEISPANWSTAMSVAHGLTIGSSPCGIDVNRSGTIAVAGAGEVLLYTGAAGISVGSIAVVGVNCVRFDAGGNVYVSGTSGLTAYTPLLTAIWSVSQPYTAISVGDQSLFCQRDSSTGSNVDVRNLSTGSLIGTAANCSSPCAVRGGLAIALQNALGVSGPIACQIAANGSVSHQGDRLTAWNSVSLSGGVYTRSGPTLSEPGGGRIGAYPW